MGAAIDVFEGAAAVRVPRSRFVPVKTIGRPALAALRRVRAERRARAWSSPRRARGTPPVIELDPEHYKLVPDLEQRFSGGPPSLVACDRLTVEGDVRFGSGVVVRGSVRVEGPREIEDGAVLEG